MWKENVLWTGHVIGFSTCEKNMGHKGITYVHMWLAFFTWTTIHTFENKAWYKITCEICTFTWEFHIFTCDWLFQMWTIIFMRENKACVLNSIWIQSTTTTALTWLRAARAFSPIHDEICLSLQKCHSRVHFDTNFQKEASMSGYKHNNEGANS